jgi:hypothetical protein
MSDPTMPRKMPPAIERALRALIAWRNAAAAPIDYYMVAPPSRLLKKCLASDG